MSKGAEVYSLTEGVISPMDDPEAFLEEAYGWTKNLVHANEKVGLALSGGIDSTVAERVLRNSIGENLYLVHMDHGFMRRIGDREESEVIAEMFSGHPNFTYRNDVRDRFYKAVTGIEDGDMKRAAFREVYKEILHESMEPLHCLWTSDGTIKPDIRETKGGIKLQHNVDLGFAQKKLEPLAALSKQEVRALAKYLGIPHLRQPFPGPGLLVRTVGKYSPEKLAVEKKANDIVEQEYRKFMLEHYGKEMIIDGETGMQIPFQTFAATFDYELSDFKIHGYNIPVLKKSLGKTGIASLDTKVTGLIDDGTEYRRIYKKPLMIMNQGVHYLEFLHTMSEVLKETDSHRILYEIEERSPENFMVAIRAIDSIDVKKAVPNFSGNVPEIAARRILEEIPEVGAVFFDITPKPPATVEYE
jgi:GMP synthase (glutamine-hydrolysing)